MGVFLTGFLTGGRQGSSVWALQRAATLGREEPSLTLTGAGERGAGSPGKEGPVASYPRGLPHFLGNGRVEPATMRDPYITFGSRWAFLI